MTGINRKWQRAERYARKGRTVGGVHGMTADEREALCKDLGRDSVHEDEREARILAIKAKRGAA